MLTGNSGMLKSKLYSKVFKSHTLSSRVASNSMCINYWKKYCNVMDP